MSSPLLRVLDLCKSFGPVQVLTRVGFELRPGEVHAVVGENGAGKSTLCRIIAGLLPADSGSMTLDASPYQPRNKREATQSGVRMVMQELNLIHTLTVAESVFIDRLPHRWGWIDRSRLHRDALAVLKRVGLTDIDPGLPVAELGVGQQQLVEIAAGISRRCRVMIFDEPTAALTDPEIEHLFQRMGELKATGTGVIYISHRMEEIQRIADRITVLRDGRLVATRASSELSMDDIVHLMVGRNLKGHLRIEGRSPGPVALRVRGLTRRPAIHNVSFQVRHGEILGVAGLMGSGRTETMRAIFGADQRDAGDLFLGDATTPTRIRSPREAVRHGLAFLTEDRKEQGLLLPLAIEKNITLASLRRLALGGSWIGGGLEQRESLPWINRLGVRCRNSTQPANELSGGNQQKVLIARWLLRNCDILIFDEPTRGIDVGARYEIHGLLQELAQQGKAVLMVSSDLKELMDVADRIAVMSAGRMVSTFSRDHWSEDEIMKAALSGYSEARIS